MRVRLKVERLVEILSRSALSQNHWAMRLGISRGHISELVNGRHPYPSAKTRQKLVDGFGVSFEELFEIEEAGDAWTHASRASFQASVADRYLVDREIGRGGMGTVHLARDVKHGRSVAIKVISPEAVTGIGAGQFLKEIRYTARLQHHHILPLFDSGEAAGYPYYVMPYMRAGSLRNLLDRHGRLALDDVVRLARGIARALAHAHGHHVIHCDVKPENVLLSEDHAYVADFGIARAVHAEALAWGRRGEVDSSAGTPAYVSPEQAAGEPHLDARSDVYSLGCMVFEMLSGAPPFGGTSTMEVVSKRFVTPVPDLRDYVASVPAGVAAVVQRAMSLEPARRLDTAMRFADALTDAGERRGVARKVVMRAETMVKGLQRAAGITAVGRRRIGRMDGIWQDVRFAARTWRRAPGFALVVLLTLTLGIGANTAIFSVVNGILLRPLPYEDPHALVALAPRAESGALGLASPPDLRDWRTRTSSFSGVAGQTSWGPTLTGTGVAEALSGANVSHDMFEILGVAPAIGRSFHPGEDQPGSPRVVVLSDVLWRRIFQADSAAVGRTMRLDDETYTVIGVMPPGFRTPAYPDARLWTILSLGSEYSRGSRFLQSVGRLRPGVSLHTAVAEMATLGRQISDEDPNYARGWSIAVLPLREHLVGDVSERLYVLLGAVGLVLFIAVANVANLFLARATGRQTELAVRAALGAGRGRIIRQLVSESLLLGLVGGMLGLALALWGTQILLGLAPPDDIPRLDDITVDLRVLTFTIALSVVAGVVFGLIPAIASSKVALAGTMRSSARGASDNRTRRRMRQGLVVAQVALAFMLLVGSGLLIRSFARLLERDPGFDRGVLTATFSLGSSYEGIEEYDRFFTSLLDRLRARPGIDGVGAVMAAPFAGRTFSGSFGIEGRSDEDSPGARLLGTSPDFFTTLGIPVLRGRAFSEADVPGAPPVAIINRTAAERYWPNQNPIGQRINVHIRFAGIPRQPPREIVGVVGDAQFETLRADADPQIYLPYRQYPTNFMNVFVRTTGNPERLEPMLREEVRALDPNVAVSDVATLGEMVGASVAADRFYMTLLTVFASVALGLASVGVYAVLAYAVSQRRNEIGIRMALGARSPDVTRLIMSEGAVLGVIGLGLGVAGAAVLHRVIAGFLFDTGSRDPLTYGAATIVILSMAMLASYVPARRARKVDPIVALRAGG